MAYLGKALKRLHVVPMEREIPQTKEKIPPLAVLPGLPEPQDSFAQTSSTEETPSKTIEPAKVCLAR